MTGNSVPESLIFMHDCAAPSLSPNLHLPRYGVSVDQLLPRSLKEGAQQEEQELLVALVPDVEILHAAVARRCRKGETARVSVYDNSSKMLMAHASGHLAYRRSTGQRVCDRRS